MQLVSQQLNKGLYASKYIYNTNTNLTACMIVKLLNEVLI